MLAKSFPKQSAKVGQLTSRRGILKLYTLQSFMGCFVLYKLEIPEP